MNKKSFTAAMVQLCGGLDIDENLRQSEDLIRKAANQGADYVLTPENTTLMEMDSGALLQRLEPEQNNSHVAFFSALAQELNIWLHIGSMGIKEEGGRIANRSFLFQPDGTLLQTYDKIHMFDVDLPGGESYRESQNFVPGQKGVMADLPWGKLGMSICYDLRFPQLYRRLARNGVSFFSVPAAFTKITGEAHWDVLLRARAIENSCFVFAAAQGGKHENGRSTYGHSMIIDPWGKILAEAGISPSVILAKIHPEQIEKVRGQLPVLKHERTFAV